MLYHICVDHPKLVLYASGDNYDSYQCEFLNLKNKGGPAIAMETCRRRLQDSTIVGAREGGGGGGVSYHSDLCFL